MGWSRERVVAELRRLHKRKADLSFTAQRGTSHWTAAIRYFGSYRAAVEAAGISYNLIWRRRLSKWNRPRICQQLRQLHWARQNISSRTLRVTHSGLHAAAIHWFGSYREAIAAAKIDYERVSQRSKNFWTRESVISEIQRLHKLGQPMHHAAIERTHSPLVTVAYRFFGTYRKAVTAAGLNYLDVRIRPHRTWNRTRVRGELLKMHRYRMGMWERQVRRQQSYLPRAARQLYGTYHAAARGAGIKRSALQPPDYRFWSPEKIVETLQAMHAANEPLYPTRLLATQSYLYRVARKRFGTYRKAIEAAGLEYPIRPLRHWSEPLVLKTLRELHDEGVDLRHAVVKKKRLPLYVAARYYFGTHVNAVRVAGINYDAMVRKQLRR